MLRSPWLPNLLWYTTLDNSGTRTANVFLRSWLKKNCASAKRGLTTRSLPPMTWLVSAGEILLTTKNWLLNLPALSSKGKYFWLAFMVRIKHSWGTCRYSTSKAQVTTLGRSTRAQTSSNNAWSSMGVSTPLCAVLAAAAAALICVCIRSRRSENEAITAP